MAIQIPQTEISPYTSQVPLVQIPPEVISGNTRPSGPLQGEFKGKGTGAWILGDSLLKGFMRGRRVKAERENAKAEESLGAMQASEQAAWNTYQEKLAKGEAKNTPDDPYYKTYADLYTSNTTKMKEFSKEDKKKTQKESKAKGEKQPTKLQSFGEKLKAFWEEHPDLIPEVGILARTAQMKPPGLAPAAQVQSLELDTAKLQNQQAQQKKNDQNMIAMYGRLTPEEIAKLPADVQKQINDPQNGLATAKSRWSMENPSKAKPDWFVDEAENFHQVAAGEEPPPGWKKYEKSTLGQAKPGTIGAFFVAGARQAKLDPENIPPVYQKYLQDVWDWKAAQSGQTTTTHLQDNGQGQMVPVTITNGYKRGSTKPQPPAGYPAFDEEGTGLSAAIQRPPAASQGASFMSGGIGKPPTAAASPKPKSGAVGKIVKPYQPGKPSAQPITGAGNVRVGSPVAGLTSPHAVAAVAKAGTDKDAAFYRIDRAYQETLKANMKLDDTTADPKTGMTAKQKADSEAAMKRKLNYIDAQRLYVKTMRQYGQTIKPGDDPDDPTGSKENKLGPPQVGDVVMVNGQKVKITSIDPSTGKATGEPVGD